MLNGFGLIMNKKNLPVVLLLLCWLLPAEMAQAKEIRIFVDNVPAFSEVSPYYNQDTLLVPARLISEELGASVDWGGSQVHITGQDVDIVLSLGQNQAIVNGEAQTLAVAPQMKQGTVFVPLRFIAEALSADVLYRDGKIFLYTPLYDDSLANQHIFRRNGDTYASLEENLFKRSAGADKSEILPISARYIDLWAVSNSGLLYSYHTLDENGEYNNPWFNYAVYSFATGQSRDVYKMPYPVATYSSGKYTDCGKVFYTHLAQSLQSFSTKNGVTVPVGEMEGYMGIFSADIDGTNFKTVFIEENHYGIFGLTYYDGWLYYQRRVPVAQEWGYDTYAGSINRVPTEGGERQQLTTEGGGAERIGEWSLQEDGLHYEQYGQEHILSFANMQDININ